MRQGLKQGISLCLIFVLLFGLCVPVLAEGGKSTFQHYLMIGDSLGIYCGSPTKEEYIKNIVPVYFNAGLPFPDTYSDLLKNDPNLNIVE